MVNKLDPDIEKKIDSLEQRIAAKRGEQAEEKIKNYGVSADSSSDGKQGKEIASQFLAVVISGWIFGLIIDRYFGSAPWGMMIFIILGFVAGVCRANAITKKND